MMRRLLVLILGLGAGSLSGQSGAATPLTLAVDQAKLLGYTDSRGQQAELSWSTVGLGLPVGGGRWQLKAWSWSDRLSYLDSGGAGWSSDQADTGLEMGWSNSTLEVATGWWRQGPPWLRLRWQFPPEGSVRAQFELAQLSLPRLAIPLPAPLRPLGLQLTWQQAVTTGAWDLGSARLDWGLWAGRTLPAQVAATDRAVEPYVSGLGLAALGTSHRWEEGAVGLSGFGGLAQFGLHNLSGASYLTADEFTLEVGGVAAQAQFTASTQLLLMAGYCLNSAGQAQIVGDLVAPFGSSLWGDFRVRTTALQGWWGAAATSGRLVNVAGLHLDGWLWVLGGRLEGLVEVQKRHDVWDWSTFPPTITAQWPDLLSWSADKWILGLAQAGLLASLDLGPALELHLRATQTLPWLLPVNPESPPPPSPKPPPSFYGGLTVNLSLSWKTTQTAHPEFAF